MLLPKISAVIMDIVPSIQTMVVCAGDRLIIMRFDKNGTPIDVPETLKENCLASAGALLTSAPLPLWQRIARSFVHDFTVKLNAAADMDRLNPQLPSRGPPVPI